MPILISAGIAALVGFVGLISVIFYKPSRRFDILFVSCLLYVGFIALLIGASMGMGTPRQKAAASYERCVRAIMNSRIGEAEGYLEYYLENKEVLDWKFTGSTCEIRPYVGDANNIIKAINSNDLEMQDIISSYNNGNGFVVSYWFKPAPDDSIMINIYSNGTVLIKVIDENRLSHLPESLTGSGRDRLPDDIRDVFYEPFETRTVSYECPECVSGIIEAFVNDSAFDREIAIRRDDCSSGSLEYYNINCNGSQSNGYWVGFRDDVPPWTEFRQAIFDIYQIAINNGNSIDSDEYMALLKEMEEKYDYESLTTYEWQDLYSESEYLREQ